MAEKPPSAPLLNCAGLPEVLCRRPLPLPYVTLLPLLMNVPELSLKKRAHLAAHIPFTSYAPEGISEKYWRFKWIERTFKSLLQRFIGGYSGKSSS